MKYWISVHSFFCHKFEKMASYRLFIMYFFNHGTTDIKQYKRYMRLFTYALRARGGLISSFVGFGSVGLTPYKTSFIVLWKLYLLYSRVAFLLQNKASLLTTTTLKRVKWFGCLVRGGPISTLYFVVFVKWFSYFYSSLPVQCCQLWVTFCESMLSW